MSNQYEKELQGALRDLRRLIDVTEKAIAKHCERGDAKSVCDLIFQQRHNLKVLFRNLEIAKKGVKR